MPPTLILLPGLDGTGRLFRPLLEVIPPHIPTRVISYATDQALSLNALFHVTQEQLREQQEMILLAESFSGPLALRLCAAQPSRVRALILCASFVTSPVVPWLRAFAWPLLFHVPIPAFFVRRFLIGRHAPASLVQEVRNAIRSVRPDVLAHRVREVLALDAATAGVPRTVPILYLRGVHDALVGPASIEAIKALRRDVHVAALDGPHLLLQAQPAAAWREIAEFLQEHGIG